MTMLLILGGFGMLIVGAELLVRGASRLAAAAGLPSLIIGLTVVAFGTSSPELAVSVKAGLTGQADIALGNVVGSNAFNVLFILGLSALIVPLAVSSQLVHLDVPVMIGVCGLTWLLAMDGRIGRGEGVVLCLGIVAYTALLIFLGRRQSNNSGTSCNQHKGRSGDGKRLAPSVVYVLAGLVLLVLGARWLVRGSVDLAGLLGVSELMIGLTIVAAGTSMPEAATSLVASLRGERDIAVGNVVGSNIFNILAVLGCSAVVSPGGVAVAPAAVNFDIPVMTATALACLPIFFTGGRISRLEGLLFLGYYAAYVTFLVMQATSSPRMTTFANGMCYFAIPLTALGLFFSLMYALGSRRRPA